MTDYMASARLRSKQKETVHKKGREAQVSTFKEAANICSLIDFINIC